MNVQFQSVVEVYLGVNPFPKVVRPTCSNSVQMAWGSRYKSKSEGFRRHYKAFAIVSDYSRMKVNFPELRLSL